MSALLGSHCLRARRQCVTLASASFRKRWHEREKRTPASERSDIPLTQRCLHKEMKNEIWQSQTRTRRRVLFFPTGKQKNTSAVVRGNIVEGGV